jgi:hypothetical protein
MNYTGIFHISALYDHKGQLFYKVQEELEKIKSFVFLGVVSDIKSDHLDDSRIYKDFKGLFSFVINSTDLVFSLVTPNKF